MCIMHLFRVHQEIERLTKANENDTLAIRAELKRKELKVDSLEKNLEAKVIANKPTF